MNSAIWWIRRDLRLADNISLQRAMQGAGQVFPVFILDEKLLSSRYSSEKRVSFLFNGLHNLDVSLRERGSYLIVRSGNPAQVLTELLNKTGAGMILAEEDYSPYAVTRDRKIGNEIPLELNPGLSVHHPIAMLKADQTPYTVYTPFNKAWQARSFSNETIPAPQHISTPSGFEGEPNPVFEQIPVNESFPAGEVEAQNRLLKFTAGPEAPVFDYQDNRDRPDLDGTAMLSPYLRFGMLSARQATSAARQAIAWGGDQRLRRGAEIWLNELIWREFYLSILYHFPGVRSNPFRSVMSQIRWLNDELSFTAWKEGKTGYPIVDAGMRQLTQEGWMHNRVRMITASFLTKDLLVDWRWGERFFMQHLIDGDPAANNGGWQWVAGTGTDAAPYFRVFNPALQSQKFDPKGVYIRRYLPELGRVPNEFIHEPWKMSISLQQETGCRLGINYPAPIVDHGLARERMMYAYKNIKKENK